MSPLRPPSPPPPGSRRGETPPPGAGPDPLDLLLDGGVVDLGESPWDPAPDEFDPEVVDEPTDEEDVVLAPPRRRFARRWGGAGSWRESVALRQSLPVRLAFGGAVIFVSALLATAGAKGYRDLQIVRQREAALAVRIAASEERLEELRHRLQLLREDPATLERLAREELGLVGKDDLVFVLPEDDGAAAADGSSAEAPRAAPGDDPAR